MKERQVSWRAKRRSSGSGEYAVSLDGDVGGVEARQGAVVEGAVDRRGAGDGDRHARRRLAGDGLRRTRRGADARQGVATEAGRGARAVEVRRQLGVADHPGVDPVAAEPGVDLARRRHRPLEDEADGADRHGPPIGRRLDHGRRRAQVAEPGQHVVVGRERRLPGGVEAPEHRVHGRIAGRRRGLGQRRAVAGDATGHAQGEHGGGEQRDETGHGPDRVREATPDAAARDVAPSLDPLTSAGCTDTLRP